jgi:hypothetical protein
VRHYPGISLRNSGKSRKISIVFGGVRTQMGTGGSRIQSRSAVHLPATIGDVCLKFPRREDKAYEGIVVIRQPVCRTNSSQR